MAPDGPRADPAVEFAEWPIERRHSDDGDGEDVRLAPFVTHRLAIRLDARCCVHVGPQTKQWLFKYFCNAVSWIQ